MQKFSLVIRSSYIILEARTDLFKYVLKDHDAMFLIFTLRYKIIYIDVNYFRRLQNYEIQTDSMMISFIIMLKILTHNGAYCIIGKKLSAKLFLYLQF